MVKKLWIEQDPKRGHQWDTGEQVRCMDHGSGEEVHICAVHR